MVGNDAFRTYYESLGLIGTRPGFVKETFRLVNTADAVPKFPRPRLNREYVHVGTEVSFNADYGADEKHTARVAATPMQSTTRITRAIKISTTATACQPNR